MSLLDQRIAQRTEAEKVLVLHLNNVIENIKATGSKDITLLQAQFGKTVQELLRSGAEAGYRQGMDYVTFVKQTPSFMTEQDLKQIKDIQFDFYDPFWRRINVILHSNDTFTHDQYEATSELNSNYIATVTGVTLTTRAIAIGTIAKLQQIQTAVAVKQAGIRAFFSDLVASVPRDTTKDQLQWNAILDKKTCPNCRNLNGQIFDYNDPRKPIPGDEFSIHPNCRCFYDILLADTSMLERAVVMSRSIAEGASIGTEFLNSDL